MNPSSLAGHTVELLDRIVKSSLPSDRVVQDFCKERRYLGSHDRRWITFRIYGLIRKYIFLGELSRRCATAVTPLNLFLINEIASGGSGAAELEKEYAGLLESYAMSGEKPDLPALEAKVRKELEYLDVNFKDTPLYYSFPDFFPELLPEGLDNEIVPLMAALNHEAQLCIRVDANKMSREEAAARFIKQGIGAELTRYSPLGLNLSKRVNLNGDLLYRDGIIEVQEEASQLVGLIVAPKAGESIVDACAGAGGKSLEIAALAGGKCEIFSLDVNEGRLRNLVTRAARNGYADIQPLKVTEDDLGDARKLTGAADKVIVDAPCSGSGTIRRNPDKKFRLTRDAVLKHGSYQLQLLKRYSDLVKIGGTLVYSTCSIFADENIGVVEAFLASDRRFRRENVGNYLPDERFIPLMENGFLITYPHRHNIDGFFAAVMKRLS